MTQGHCDFGSGAVKVPQHEVAINGPLYHSNRSKVTKRVGAESTSDIFTHLAAAVSEPLKRWIKHKPQQVTRSLCSFFFIRVSKKQVTGSSRATPFFYNSDPTFMH